MSKLNISYNDAKPNNYYKFSKNQNVKKSKFESNLFHLLNNRWLLALHKSSSYSDNNQSINVIYYY